MNGLRKNAITYIFGHYWQKRQILEIFGKNGQNGNFSQTSARCWVSRPSSYYFKCLVFKRVKGDQWGLKFFQTISKLPMCRYYLDCLSLGNRDNSDEPMRKTSFLSIFKMIKGDQRGLKFFQTISKLPMFRYYLDLLQFQKLDNSDQSV